MTEKKTLTLSIKRKTGKARKLRGNKRLIINTEASTAKPKEKPVKRTKKPTQPQIKKTPPSEIRANELDQLLGERFTAWRDNEPLSITGIEKQIFQLISAEHLPYSKRVVQRVLKRHCTSTAYLNSVLHGNSRVSLDNEIVGKY